MYNIFKNYIIGVDIWLPTYMICLFYFDKKWLISFLKDAAEFIVYFIKYVFIYIISVLKKIKYEKGKK